MKIEESYTISEVSDILDIPRPTIVSWIKNGKIPKEETQKKGNMLLISSIQIKKMAKTRLEEIERQKKKLEEFLK